MIDFSVLIPVFNTKAAHLQEAVNSILEQSHPSPNPIIIIDDGSSSEETLICLQEFAAYKEIQVHTLDDNYGVSYALNYGHRIVNSEYIALQGSDDISHKERFKKQCDFIERRGPIDVLGTNLMTFWDHDPKRKSIFTSKHDSIPKRPGFIVNHGTVMYRNQAVIDVGGYDVTKRKAQDIDLFNRMIKARYKFHNLNETLYSWRRFDKKLAA